MSEPAPSPPEGSARPWTPWLVGGAIAAFALFLLALAFPPDASPTAGDAHALSRSPVGYAGVLRLLRGAGASTFISRSGRPLPGVRSDALLVVTPRATTPDGDVLKLARGRRVLIVPPKWQVVADPARPGRVLKAGLLAPQRALTLADAALGASGPRALVTTGRMAPALHGASPDETMPSTSALQAIDRLRTFTGPALTPIMADARGQLVLVRAADRPVYVLSDPDLLNNHGVSDLDTARAAVALLVGLADGAPVVWDVSLDGYAAQKPAKNPFRMLFLPPLLPATLCLFVAAALTALAARARFGAMQDAGRAYGFGKRALVDSAASIIALAGREARFAPRYAELARAAAVESVGLAASPQEVQDAALDRIGEARGVGGWSEVWAQARSVSAARGLLASARRTWTWRREMTRGRG